MFIHSLLICIVDSVNGFHCNVNISSILVHQGPDWGVEVKVWIYEYMFSGWKKFAAFFFFSIFFPKGSRKSNFTWQYIKVPISAQRFPSSDWSIISIFANPRDRLVHCTGLSFILICHRKFSKSILLINLSNNWLQLIIFALFVRAKSGQYFSTTE